MSMAIQQSKFPIAKHKNPANTLKKLTDKEKLGKIAEQVEYNPFKKACNELGLTLVWSGQNAYKKATNEEKHDVDFKVYYGDKLLKVFESKNWRTIYNRKYDKEIAQDEVISRIENYPLCDTGLIISDFNVFSQPAQELITKQGNYNNVIETEKLLGKHDFKGKIYHKLYKLFYDDLKASLEKLQNYLAHIQQQLTQALTPILPQLNDPTVQLQTNGDTIFLLSNVKSNQSSNGVINTVTVDSTVKQLSITQTNNTPLESKVIIDKIDSKKGEIEDLDMDKQIEIAKKTWLVY